MYIQKTSELLEAQEGQTCNQILIIVYPWSKPMEQKGIL